MDALILLLAIWFGITEEPDPIPLPGVRDQVCGQAEQPACDCRGKSCLGGRVR